MATNKTQLKFLRPAVSSNYVLYEPNPIVNGCIIDQIDKELKQRNVQTTRENITSVLENFTRHYPPDEKVIGLMVINYIEQYVKTQLEFERNNFKTYNIWSTTTEQEQYGLRSHPEIKLRKRKLNPQFVMNY